MANFQTVDRLPAGLPTAKRISAAFLPILYVLLTVGCDESRRADNLETREYQRTTYRDESSAAFNGTVVR
jgi:hypothetical protein